MSSVKPINRSRNTQLASFPYDTSKLIFDEPVSGSIPGNNIPFFRINIGTKNNNKTEGDLVFALPKLNTYGVKESLDPSTKALTGYGAGLILFDRDEQTEEHVIITNTISEIVEKCKDHLTSADVKMKINKTKLKRELLDPLSPLYFCKDKDTKEEQLNKPVLNVKLLYKKSYKDKDGIDVDGKISTPFYQDDEVDENGEPIPLSPDDFLNKFGSIRAVIKVESIFVGKDIKLQVKVLEAAFKQDQKTTKSRFLSFNNTSSFQSQLQEISNSIEEEPLQIPIHQVSLNEDELVISDDESSKKKKKPTKK